MVLLFSFVIALLFVGFVTLVALAMLIEIARRLFWFVTQVAASAAVVAVGAACALDFAPPEAAWVAAPVAVALVLWASRDRGSAPVEASPLLTARVVDSADFCRMPARVAKRARIAAVQEEANAVETRTPPGAPMSEASDMRLNMTRVASLIDPALRDRMATTEAALACAARDDIGQPAADWLTFWRRRVPDLIASAQDVWDDTIPAERPPVAADLASSLQAIIAEADTRLATIRGARRDLFTTRTNHARAQVREG